MNNNNKENIDYPEVPATVPDFEIISVQELDKQKKDIDKIKKIDQDLIDQKKIYDQKAKLFNMITKAKMEGKDHIIVPKEATVNSDFRYHLKQQKYKVYKKKPKKNKKNWSCFKAVKASMYYIGFGLDAAEELFSDMV